MFIISQVIRPCRHAGMQVDNLAFTVLCTPYSKYGIRNKDAGGEGNQSNARLIDPSLSSYPAPTLISVPRLGVIGAPRWSSILWVTPDLID